MNARGFMVHMTYDPNRRYLSMGLNPIHSKKL